MLMSEEQLQQLIEDLRGSCQSLAECMPTGFDENDLTQDQHEAIDEAIFECARCNWWCESSEEQTIDDNADERICQECYET